MAMACGSTCAIAASCAIAESWARAGRELGESCAHTITHLLVYKPRNQKGRKVGSEHLDVLPHSHLPPPHVTRAARASSSSPALHTDKNTRERRRGTRHTARTGPMTTCRAQQRMQLICRCMHPMTLSPRAWTLRPYLLGSSRRPWLYLQVAVDAVQTEVPGTWAANARRQQRRQDACRAHPMMAWGVHGTLRDALESPRVRERTGTTQATCLDHVASAGNKEARIDNVAARIHNRAQANRAQRQDTPQMSDPSNRGSAVGQREEERARPFSQTPALRGRTTRLSCQHGAADVDAGHGACQRHCRQLMCPLVSTGRTSCALKSHGVCQVTMSTWCRHNPASRVSMHNTSPPTASTTHHHRPVSREHAQHTTTTQHLPPPSTSSLCTRALGAVIFIALHCRHLYRTALAAG
jgi:hypothetical protein